MVTKKTLLILKLSNVILKHIFLDLKEEKFDSRIQEFNQKTQIESKN